MISRKRFDAGVNDLLLSIGQLIRRVRAESASHDLSLTEYSVLVRLDKEGPATTAELARAEGMKPQSMGAAVAALEKLGYVERRPHPTDGRQVRIALTADGAEVRRATRAAKRLWLANAISGLDEKEQATLFAAGDIIKRLVESTGGEAVTPAPSSAPTVDAEASDRPDPRVWRIAGVAFLGPFMAQMDSTIVNFSLSSIRDGLHSSIDAAHWIISAYLLALALTLPLNGWLVDRVGAKRLYLGCFTAFTLASVLCGAAPSMNALILARVLQGVAGGLLAPMTQLMIARAAGNQMARVMGFTVVPVLLAPLLGPVFAGAILKYSGWPWLFYVNLPVGIVAVALAAALLPSDDASIERRRFDLPGFLLISPALVCLLYGVDQVPHWDGVLILAVGVLLAGAFAWHALRAPERALIDLRLFRVRVFAVAARTQFLANGLAYAGQLLIPLYLTVGCGLSPAEAGWRLAPMGLGMMFTYPMMGFLNEKFGCRAVAAGGAAIVLVGTLPFLWMIHGGLSTALLTASLVTRGAGQGAIGIPSLSAAYAAVPRSRLAVATTAINIVQRLGGPIATTALALVISFAATRVAGGPQVFLIPFVALIGLQLLVLSSAARLPSRIEQVRRESGE